MNFYARLGQLLKTLDITCVLDVGAHVGGFSRRLREAGYRGRIIAFEPLPDIFLQLEANGADPLNLESYPFALGPQDGAAAINVTRNLYSSSLLQPRDESVAIEQGVEVDSQTEVQVRSLDGLSEQLRLPGERIFLKLDVQGYERQVLTGAAGVLSRAELLQVELSFFGSYQGGWRADEAFTYLYQAGYRIVAMKEDWSDPKTGEALEGDFVFARGHMPLGAAQRE